MSKKICKLFKKGLPKEDWESYKAGIKDPKVICKSCGRAASDALDVCKPEKI